MLNVWTRTDDDRRKCRTVVAGNHQAKDPTEQTWTAQAEPSTILITTKLALMKGWSLSKHDVKGAFLEAPIPDGQIIVVQPPAQWVRWDIVKPGTLWTLQKAVYGLRQSPKWWGDHRGETLGNLQWEHNGSRYHLQQNPTDTQLWTVRAVDGTPGVRLTVQPRRFLVPSVSMSTTCSLPCP